MSPLEFIVAVLSAWQIVEVWHHGSIFASQRAYMEARGGFLGNLMSCPFCLSVWVGWVTVGWILCCSWLGYSILNLPLIGLAVSRAANACNDVFKQYNLTPDASDDFLVPPDTGTDSGPEADSE